MPRRLTNLLLLALVLGLAASGLLGWVLPAGGAWPLYDLHRALGAALALALLGKVGIARSSLVRRLGRGRPDRSVLVGLAAGALLLGCLALGAAWTLNAISLGSFGGYSPLNLHVFLGLGLVPLTLWHLSRRWERRPALGHLVTRRTALRLLALSAATAAGWQIVERAAEALAAPGSRRPSGSKHAGSFSGNAYPVTIWLLDSVPQLDVAEWRLHISGRVARPASLGYPDLTGLERRELRAVIDCTGGWWSEQIWGGVPVAALLDAAGLDPAARSARVVSVTGHGVLVPIEELRRALLATHVGGEPLSPGHGHPARLVLPERRGFQWVKWVDRIEVT